MLVEVDFIEKCHSLKKSQHEVEISLPEVETSKSNYYNYYTLQTM